MNVETSTCNTTSEITGADPKGSGTGNFESSVPQAGKSLFRHITTIMHLDKDSVLALFDQALVSAASLVASVIVGRSCGADGLGVYALGMTFFVLFTAMQTAIISTPYTVLRTRLKNPDDAKRFAGSSLAGSMMVSVVAVSVLMLLYLVFLLTQVIPGFEKAILAVVALIPLLMIRDFARRYSFANFQIGAAVALDLCVFLLQIGGLLLLVQLDLLTPIFAFACMGLACGIAAVTWLVLNRRKFLIDSEVIKDDLKEKWRLGRWLSMELVLGITGAYIVHWLLIFQMDSTATGVFAACLVIVNLSSPFLQGMGNILSPRFASAATEEDRTAIQKLYRRTTIFMTTVMALFVTACIFFGESAMQLLYPGQEYSGYGLIVVLLSIRALIGSTFITAHHALVAMEEPRPGFWCTLVGVLASLAFGIYLIPIMGILGGAIALVIGTSLEVVGLYFSYQIVMRKYQPVIRQAVTQ